MGDHSICNPPSVVPDLNSASGPDEKLFLLCPFIPEKVCLRLKMENSSAVGVEGLEASFWRKVDPGGVIPSRIFTRCLKLGRVPSTWKKEGLCLLKIQNITYLLIAAGTLPPCQ